eukprot:1665299-Rhodomonas_salina.1
MAQRVPTATIRQSRSSRRLVRGSRRIWRRWCAVMAIPSRAGEPLSCSMAAAQLLTADHGAGNSKPCRACRSTME